MRWEILRLTYAALAGGITAFIYNYLGYGDLSLIGVFEERLLLATVTVAAAAFFFFPKDPAPKSRMATCGLMVVFVGYIITAASMGWNEGVEKHGDFQSALFDNPVTILSFLLNTIFFGLLAILASLGIPFVIGVLLSLPFKHGGREQARP